MKDGLELIYLVDRQAAHTTRATVQNASGLHAQICWKQGICLMRVTKRVIHAVVGIYTAGTCSQSNDNFAMQIQEPHMKQGVIIVAQPVACHGQRCERQPLDTWPTEIGTSSDTNKNRATVNEIRHERAVPLATATSHPVPNEQSNSIEPKCQSSGMEPRGTLQPQTFCRTTQCGKSISSSHMSTRKLHSWCSSSK